MNLRHSYLYALMEIEVLKLGQPTSYQGDFEVHDRKIVASMEESETWHWLIRENGTHLFRETNHIRHILSSSSEVVALYRITTGNGHFKPEVQRIPYGWMFKP